MKISSREIASKTKLVSAKLKSLYEITFEFLGIGAFESYKVGAVNVCKSFRYFLS